MNTEITIMIVDDHALVRDALGEWLGREPDMSVVARAADADEAVTLAIRLNPRVVLMDIDMPGLACFAAAKTMQSQCPDTRVVFLSAFVHDRHIDSALAAGACGYVTKGEPPEAVVNAVRCVADGDAYFSPEVRDRIVIGSDGATLAEKGRSRLSMLTDREVEILRYVANGLAKKEIAQTVHISVKTVENHCTHLMSKLDIHDRVGLTRFAIREGLAEA